MRNALSQPAIVAAALTASALLPTLAHATIPTPGLIGYFAADNNANDSSPIANSGSFTGSYTAGQFGSAFNLATGVVSIPDAPAYSLNADYTIGFWFNRNSTAGGTFLAQDNGGGSLPKLVIDYGYTGSHFELHLNGPGGLVFLPSNDLPLPNGWNQLTIAKSATTYNFYLNGSPIGSPTSAVTFSDPTANLTFGFAEPAVPTFTGLLDDVTLYNRALSPAEVVQLSTTPEPATLSLLSLALPLALRRRPAR